LCLSKKQNPRLSELANYEQATLSAQGINQDIVKAQEDLGKANNILEIADVHFQEKMTAYEQLRAKQDELQALTDQASEQVEITSVDAGKFEMLQAELASAKADADDKYLPFRKFRKFVLLF